MLGKPMHDGVRLNPNKHSYISKVEETDKQRPNKVQFKLDHINLDMTTAQNTPIAPVHTHIALLISLEVEPPALHLYPRLSQYAHPLGSVVSEVTIGTTEYGCWTTVVTAGC